MPIVSHSIESSTQADGSTSNVLKLYDQDGKEFLSTFYAPPGFNLATKISNTILELNEQLAQTEFETLIG